MKVLLIQSHLGRIKSFPPLFPIGICYIATALQGKHKVKILDLNLRELPQAYEELEKEIVAFAPDVAGISIRDIDTTSRADIFFNFKTIRPTAQLIKKANSNVKLLAGGAGFSIFAQKIMERIPEFDYGVFLEGEESVSELLENLGSPEKVKGIFYRKNGTVTFTGLREFPDFSKVPIPVREPNLIDINQYIGPMENNIGIQSKRGCMLNCIYCGYPFLSGRRLRLRMPQSVADEIEYLMKLGVRKFTFVDNIFNIPPAHAKGICEEIIKRGLDIEWSAWFEIKNATKELILLAKKAGCKHFGFSPDGSTNKALSVLKKDITEEDIGKNLEIIKKTDGIRAGYNFFLTLPNTGLRDMIKTLILYFKIPIFLFGRGSVYISWVRIEPHTEIHKIAIEEGSISKDTDLLPAEQSELPKLFYTNPSYRYFEYSVLYLIKFMEQVVKPFGKFILRHNLVRKKKSK